MASELWEHQRIGVEKAKNLDFFAFFFEQGCGKTRTVIEVILGKFLKEGRTLRSLIVCPDIVVKNWQDEFLKYTDLHPSTVVCLTGSGQQRLDTLLSAPLHTIFVCNYQTLLMKPLLEVFKKIGIELLVLDESHKIKSYNSVTTKNILPLAARAKYRFCMSGTPVTKNEMDIYPQSQVLDGGAALGANFFTFRNKYFFDKNKGMRSNYFPKWEIKKGSKEAIRDAMAHYTMRVEKADCLDLPPLIKQTMDVALTPIQEKLYRDLERDMVGALGDNMVVSDMALTNILRMQQLVSGFCTDQLNRHFQVEGNREAVLKETIEGIAPRHKVIIWAVFKQNYYDIRRVLTELGEKFCELTGDVPTKYRPNIVKQFQDPYGPRFLIANPKAAGIGINLVEAAYSIRYSRSYSLEDQLQSEARNYRAGSEMHEQVVQIELLTRGTIDEVIFNALADKAEIGPAIINHYKKGSSL